MATLIHALEKRHRERERENHSRGARPPNLLNIALCELASSCLHLCPFCSCLRGRTLAPSLFTPCVYIQRQKKQASRQAKKQIEGKHAKRQASKGCQMGASKHVKHMKRQTNMLSNKRGCPRRKNVGLDRVSIVPLDWSMNDT